MLKRIMIDISNYFIIIIIFIFSGVMCFKMLYTCNEEEEEEDCAYSTMAQSVMTTVYIMIGSIGANMSFEKSHTPWLAMILTLTFILILTLIALNVCSR